MHRFSRRDAFRLSGLGAVALFEPRLLLGCSNGASVRQPGGVGMATEAGVPSWNFDPSAPWWMQFNFGPVADEQTEMTLEVEGSIPPELDGLYLRNGSNPKFGDSAHWFVGNGMVHGVRLKNGKALWYKNRYIDTPHLHPSAADAAPAVVLPGPTDTDSNVSLVSHGGKLLALGEVGLPFQLSADDLSTVGPWDFDGKLTTWMTAHPKLDPVTGEMLFFGYGGVAPYLTYHRADANGILTRSEVIDLPGSVMMHDFQVTATRVIFMDLPIVLDLDAAIAGSHFPFKWDPSHQARFGVMPRDGGNSDVVWIDIETCFIFHTMNAYDDADGNIVLEACRLPEIWVDGPAKFDHFPNLERYTIDVAAGTARRETIDDRLLEFPQLNRSRAGLDYRYGYGLWLADPDGSEHPDGVKGIVKFDRTRNESTVHAFDAALWPDEAFFVASRNATGEDAGWLFSYVYDRRTDRTDLYIVDASNMSREPIAKIKLPFRVPFGFHGLWVPAVSA
ncbi:MAG TPA: carotenoid oxygenase family protein [Polyangiaceae bacterium]|jgi:carotenoid cleavage dioxygenase|nr:carotenoid oxygenase family protein [Polyangiaceae bacterium]